MHEIKRSKLHKIDVMSWLNKTHGKTASDSYKFLPEDLVFHPSILLDLKIRA
jgi:hypothetical protein